MTKSTHPPSIPHRSWEVVSDDAHPINLEVRHRTGDGCFFPYAYLVYCRYDRGGIIEMHFSSWVLRVEGRNLGDLYAALNKHAVSFIQEGEQEESAAESGPFVSQLVVAEAEG